MLQIMRVVLLFAGGCCRHVGETPDRGARRVTHLRSRGEKTHRINQGAGAPIPDRLRGFSPAAQSFNKSDMSDLGKRFNGCFLSVFQHSVGGWSNATGQGRHSDVRRFKWMFLQNNKHFPEYQSRKVSD